MPEHDTTMPLKDRWAMVTGGSSGLGRATAKALADAGAHVWVHCRQNARGAEEICNQIRSLGRQSQYTLGDLAEAETIHRILGDAQDWGHGAPDIWINNAGADVLTGDAAAWSFDKKLETLWKVDVVACLKLSRAIGARMKQMPSNSDRVIINVGWDQAEHGMEGDSGEMFATIKGAVMAFSRSLAKSLAPEVRVNCVAPGWIRTAWGEEASTYWQQRAQRESLLQRWGTPEDVANAICFLASPSAQFMTSVTLPVNGGFRHSPPSDAT